MLGLESLSGERAEHAIAKHVRSRKDDDLGGESRFEGIAERASGAAERAAARKELVGEFVEARAVAKSVAKRVH